MSSEMKSMHMGQITSFFIPNVTLVGSGCSKEIPNRMKALGGKYPLIVTDKGIVACGILKQITDILDAAVMKYCVYDETVPNPTDKNVEAATKMYKDNKCDSLITIGGGSSHDCGKGVGFVAGCGGTIHDYEGVDKSSKPFPPYVAVNTTAGTGSEMTRFCIITDTSRKVKMAIVDWRCTPSVAIDDPDLMMGMPPALTAATGPSHTRFPPASPPPGPRSTIQSAQRITSTLCSMTMTVLPPARSFRSSCMSLAMSSKWRPVVGSSRR